MPTLLQSPYPSIEIAARRTLPPYWQLGGDEPLLQLGTDGKFRTNHVLKDWIEACPDGSYLKISTDPLERTITIRRCGPDPMAAYAREPFFHYGLHEVLTSHGYEANSELVFEPSGDADEMVAQVWPRNGGAA